MLDPAVLCMFSRFFGLSLLKRPHSGLGSQPAHIALLEQGDPIRSPDCALRPHQFWLHPRRPQEQGSDGLVQGDL